MGKANPSMIEIFKTNVTERRQANSLIESIHNTFADHKANFDLHDIDNILRVECVTGTIKSASMVEFIKDCGYKAEVLPG